MLNKEQLRKQVIQYFRSVGSGQNIVQCIKEALFLHQKFNPVILFQVISRGKQKISKQDWRQYFLHRNIAFNQDQIRYFFNINSFGDHITLNQFLESMIPYNADVIRQFKAKYLDSLQIRQFDVQVQFIFSQLLSNWVKFIRNVMKIRSQITKIATKKQIQQLIKQDLVLKSKPRQARKFHQNFQTRDFSNLSFHQLRKFLQLWVSSKQIIHQFYLLNVKRHLKSQYPFDKIVFKNSRMSKSKTEKHRSLSAYKISNKAQLTNQKLKEKVEVDDKKFDTADMKFQNFSGDKYDEYKKQIMQDFVKQKHGLGKSVGKSSNKKQYQRQELHSNNEHQTMIRQSRYQREQKGIDGTYIVNLFQQIKLRKHLAKLNDFNLINLFRLIDHRNQGFITVKHLSDFTGDNRVQFNYLIQFYARQKNKLRFHQFCIFFRPLSKQLNDIIDARPEHKVPNPFKRETSKLILQVLHLTAEMHTNLMKIKEKINRDGIDPINLFRHIDLGDKKYISADCIKTVLQENNIFCEARDLKCLMKFFKKKVDQRISPQQFVSFIDL